MVESAAASNPPTKLQARPPTPPRDSIHNILKLGRQREGKPGLLGDLTRFLKADSRRASAPVSRSSAVESPVETPGSASGTGKKRVGWSEETEYKDPPIASFDGKNIRHIVQPLAPSSERKPSKSILKISSNGGNEQDLDSMNTKLLPPHHHPSFATMLDSIVQQLGGKDRSSKMDSYLVFSGLLKASDNVPDLKALKSKMGLLCQFITQDMSEKLENGKSDTGLVVNALVLLSSFLHKPAITEMFPAEFPVQIVEHAIKSFEDPTASKEISKHLMFIMAQQNFSSKVLTAERVGRLIIALHNIENHIKGKSIAMSRISILRSLLRSSRSHMLATANTVWFEDMFNDMLSSLKEVRTVAIAFGFEAAITLGAESNTTRAVSNLFKQATGEKHYADFYADRLKIMVKNKNDWDSSTVPQIWSIVILFLRSKPQALVQWQFLHTFLEVIQHSFNSSDTATKTEANLAWNRLIFALQLNEKTTAKFRAIVSTALITQLKARKSSTIRKACLNSIYILLYYALKPQSTSTQLDLFWDEFVIPIINGCLTSAKSRSDPNLAQQDALEACVILYSLFDSKTPRKWYETRAVDSLQTIPMDPSELPALNSKWLRKNHIRVFKVLGPLMEMLYWDLGSDSEINRLWRTYMSSIGSPAVGEVTIQVETMSSIASMLSMLHKFWLKGGEKLECLPPPDDISTTQRTSAFIRSFENIFLVAVSLDGLQLAPFTDKRLGITQDTFVAVSTPSLSFRHPLTETKSPLYHLILLLTNPSPGLEYDRQFFRMVDKILSPFVNARASKIQVDLIYDLAHLLPSESSEPSRMIWQVLAEFATTAVDTRDSSESHGDEPLISKYGKLVRIMAIGVNLFPGAPLPAWRHIFEATVNSATLEAGEAGRAIAVIEELAKVFTPKVPCPVLSSKQMLYLSLLLEKANYPKDRQALDSAHRKLRGTGNPQHKSALFDPYVHLSEYTNTTLTEMYESHSKDHARVYSDVISAITGLLGRCPTALLLPVIVKLQPGIKHWITDNDQKLPGGDSLSKNVSSLWVMLKKIMSRLLEPYGNSKILKDLEPLVCAGLNSKHGSIVNGTITFWNTTFGACEERFEYPNNIMEVLLRLRTVADVQMPYLAESLVEESLADQRQPLALMDTQDDSYGMSSTPNDSIMGPMRRSIPQVIIGSRRSMSLKRSRDNTPDSSRRKSRKRDITPRLRHDDSQVQFQAVESSPMADRVMNSQLLTDKQKETKERQQAEQSMFPDLRPTPIPREKSTRKPEEPEMELPTRQSSQLRTKPAGDRQATPTLPIPSDDDGYVASSPTPTRSLRGDRDLQPAIDPPSSPPVAPTKKSVYVESTSPTVEQTPEPAIETAAVDAPEPKQVEENPSSPPESTPESEDAMDMDEDKVEEEQPELPEETNAGVDDMDLDPAADLEKELQLPEYDTSKDGPGNTDQTNLGQSAQVESFQHITMSTFEFTPDVRHSSPVEDDPSEQLRASQREEYLKWSIEDDVDDIEQTSAEPGATGKNDPEPEPVQKSQKLQMIPLLEPLPPGTPVRHPISSPVHHVDAQSGPTSSDRQDVFEDAVSSPRIHVAKPATLNPSTPDDYGTGNDSSFLRAVNQYDQPLQKGAFFTQLKDSPRRSTRAPASKHLEVPSSIDVSRIRKLAFGKASTFQNTASPDKEPTSTTPGNKFSSIPSLIPETPGLPALEERIVDDDGQEVENTIVVDTSSLKHWRPTVKRGKRKGRKGKHHEASGDSNEIPDSQDAMAGSETSSPQKRSPSKRSPAKKKPRGQSSRASQFSQEESEIESSQDFRSQSLSMDLDTSRQEMEIDGTTMSFTPNAEVKEALQDAADEPEVEQSFGESFVEQGAADVEIEKSIVQDTTEDVDTEAGREEEATSPSFDVIEETTIDETSLFEKSSPAVEPGQDIGEEIVSHPSPEPPAPEGGVEPVEPEPAVVAEVEVPAVTAETMADKLQSLLIDLQTASLSRQEFGRLEDLFIDAKRRLYDAEERGRVAAKVER